MHPWDRNWVIQGRLGKGGQGITSCVKHRTTDQLGVLKKLKNNRSEQCRARMQREVGVLRSLAAFCDWRVPRVLEDNCHELDNPGTELYLVMGFIEGPTLSERIRTNGPFNLDDAARVTLGISGTLALAHKEGVLHRDIKPDNIVFDHSSIDRPVLIDFGLSFNHDESSVTQAEETFRNKFVDLPEYNTQGGNKRDPRSDITALSAILYYCLSGNRIGQLWDGKPPHRREGCSIRKTLENDFRMIAVESFLDRGFRPAIEERFQSVEEFVSRLNSVLQSAKDRNALSDVAAAAFDKLQSKHRPTLLSKMYAVAKQGIDQGLSDIIRHLSIEISPFELDGSMQSAQSLEQPPTEHLCEMTLHMRLLSGKNLAIQEWDITVAAEQHELILVVRHSQHVTHKDFLTGEALAFAFGTWEHCARFSPDCPDIPELIVNGVRELLRNELSFLL